MERGTLSVVRLHPKKKFTFFMPCLSIEWIAILMSTSECLDLTSSAYRNSGKDGGGM